jgi:hypothetical protein
MGGGGSSSQATESPGLTTWEVLLATCAGADPSRSRGPALRMQARPWALEEAAWALCLCATAPEPQQHAEGRARWGAAGAHLAVDQHHAALDAALHLGPAGVWHVARQVGVQPQLALHVGSQASDGGRAAGRGGTCQRRTLPTSWCCTLSTVDAALGCLASCGGRWRGSAAAAAAAAAVLLRRLWVLQGRRGYLGGGSADRPVRCLLPCRGRDALPAHHAPASPSAGQHLAVSGTELIYDSCGVVGSACCDELSMSIGIDQLNNNNKESPAPRPLRPATCWTSGQNGDADEQLLLCM